MSNTNDLWLFAYKNAVGKECYMAVFEADKSKALSRFIANREPTDRLIGETAMTKDSTRTGRMAYDTIRV